MKVEFIFAWYDLWVGFYWDRKNRWLYFLPVPMFGLVFKFDAEGVASGPKQTVLPRCFCPPGETPAVDVCHQAPLCLSEGWRRCGAEGVAGGE